VSESIRFDRAAEFYDRTRSVSEESMSRTVELLTSELGDRGLVLEVGVGTGLLALPLHGAGLSIAGIDLSAPMLERLTEKAGGKAPFPVVQGDATLMPFADDAFGAAHLRWVLHLIPQWRTALAEIARVVRPAGVFLANLGSYGGARREIQLRFQEVTGVSTDPVGLGWAGLDVLDEQMAALGAAVRTLPPIREGGTETLEEFIERIEENRYSWTWRVSDEVRLLAAAEIRPWARERFGSLDEPSPFEHATTWRAYDLP
jgi:SAM-dependent methyltransferase